MAYLDEYTEADLKAILTKWYGPHNIKNINLNQKVLMLTAEALRKTEGCSSSMKWVPQGANPFTAAAGLTGSLIGYAKTLVKDAAKKQTYSQTCVMSESRNYKQAILEAGQF